MSESKLLVYDLIKDSLQCVLDLQGSNIMICHLRYLKDNKFHIFCVSGVFFLDLDDSDLKIVVSIQSGNQKVNFILIGLCRRKYG